MPGTTSTVDSPRDGETCSCGRPAVIVYVTERFGRVGHCGVSSETWKERAQSN